MTNVLLTVATMLILSAVLFAADMTGNWELYLERTFSGGPGTTECSFRQDAEKLAGTCANVDVAGTVDGRKVNFQFEAYDPTGQKIAVAYSGELNEREDAITGTWRAIKPPANLQVKDGRFRLTKLARQSEVSRHAALLR
jgi:hypothetical protein